MICMPRTTFDAMATLHMIHMPDLGLHLGRGNVLPGLEQAPRNAPTLTKVANRIVPGVIVLFQRGQLSLHPRAGRPI